MLVTLSVLLLLGVAGCGGDPRADAGAVLPIEVEPGPGRASYVVVPWGRLDIELGPLRKEIPGHRAPDGGRFVAVRLEPDTAKVRPLPRRPGAELEAPAVSLVAGGRTYPIKDATVPMVRGGSVLGVKRNLWVAVRDADDLQVRVTYDGVTQTPGQRTGRVAGLYRPLDTHRTGAVTFDRLPYVGGVGWAKPGRAWLIVTHPRGQRATVDGRPPRETWQLNDATPGLKDPKDPTQALFDVPASRPTDLEVGR